MGPRSRVRWDASVWNSWLPAGTQAQPLPSTEADPWDVGSSGRRWGTPHASAQLYVPGLGVQLIKHNRSRNSIPGVHQQRTPTGWDRMTTEGQKEHRGPPASVGPTFHQTGPRHYPGAHVGK